MNKYFGFGLLLSLGVISACSNKDRPPPNMSGSGSGNGGGAPATPAASGSGAGTGPAGAAAGAGSRAGSASSTGGTASSTGGTASWTGGTGNAANGGTTAAGGTAGAGAGGGSGTAAATPLVGTMAGTAICAQPLPSGLDLVITCDGSPSAAGLCVVADAAGLSWTFPPLCSDRSAARALCEGLALDGHSDWRLPTIDDLRGLVSSCPSTQRNGTCQVTAECTSIETCWTEESCQGCNVGGLVPCRDPNSYLHRMLSDTVAAPSDSVWALDCAFGARVEPVTPETPALFQCVR